MTTINRMFRRGTGYRVILACDHSFDVSGAELKERRLFIGKRISCVTCAGQEEVHG